MRIFDYLNGLKWKRLCWKARGTSGAGKGFKVIHPECISIGERTYFGYNLLLQAWKIHNGISYDPYIEIGNHVSMMENCQISCCNKITIGDGALFGANVFITDNFHGDNSIAQLDIPPIDRPLDVRGEVVIGDNVWVGRNVCIMPGVHIGVGAVIGANAVVTHDIPAYSVAAGVPAKVIKRVEKNS